MIFRINTFFQQHIQMPQNYFRAGFQKRFSPSATIRDILARYLQVHDWDPAGSQPCPLIKDLGGLIVIEYGNHTS